MTPKRECLRCKKTISEKRPVFLVSTPTGEIVGPLHPPCAAAIAAEGRLLGRPSDNGARVYGRLLARERWQEHALPDLPTEGEQ